MNETTTYTEQQISDWSYIFGSSAGMWGWWQQISFLDQGDWDKPGVVLLAADDPDNEDASVSKTLRPEDIFAALDKATELYPWHFVRRDGELDLDADSADLVLQVALFGDAIYG